MINPKLICLAVEKQYIANTDWDLSVLSLNQTKILVEFIPRFVFFHI